MPNETTPLLDPSAGRLAEHEDSAIDIRIRRDLSDLVGGHDSDDEDEFVGRSTFSQALANSLGDLIGTGLLASPIAIAYAGWLVGGGMMALLGFMTHRTYVGPSLNLLLSSRVSRPDGTDGRLRGSLACSCSSHSCWITRSTPSRTRTSSASASTTGPCLSFPRWALRPTC